MITVTNACQDEGRREAKQTEPNIAVFNDAALDTLGKRGIHDVVLVVNYQHIIDLMHNDVTW